MFFPTAARTAVSLNLLRVNDAELLEHLDLADDE